MPGLDRASTLKLKNFEQVLGVPFRFGPSALDSDLDGLVSLQQVEDTFPDQGKVLCGIVGPFPGMVFQKCYIQVPMGADGSSSGRKLVSLYWPEARTQSSCGDAFPCPLPIDFWVA
jgi:hypothetical protein